MGSDCKNLLVALLAVCWAGLASSQDRVSVPQQNPFKLPLPPPSSSPVRPALADNVQDEPLILQLRATLVSKDAPLAVVGNRVLAIGEEIKGYRLLSVREGEAVFAGGGGRLTLRVGLDEADDHGD